VILSFANPASRKKLEELRKKKEEKKKLAQKQFD